MGEAATLEASLGQDDRVVVRLDLGARRLLLEARAVVEPLVDTAVVFGVEVLVSSVPLAFFVRFQLLLVFFLQRGCEQPPASSCVMITSTTRIRSKITPLIN